MRLQEGGLITRTRTLWHRPARRRIAGTLAAVVVATATLGAVVAGGAASAATTTITVYNGQHVQTTDALVSAFEKKTGIRVAVRSDTENTLADQILAEGSRSPADVIYTENSPTLEELQTKGLLAPVDSSTLGHTPSRYNSDKGRWVGVSARVSVIVYNTHLLKRSQLPTSVLQLAQPKWKGKLALAPGETDFQPIVTAVDRARGAAATVKWLDGLKSNAGSHIYSDNETITSEVNAGQVALGVINQYYWYRLQAELGASQMHSAIAYFAPHDPGYVVDVSGAAILASSSHKAAAQKFLAFLNSKQGEEIIAKGDSFEYPLGSKVTTAAPETPFNQLQPDDITPAELGTGTLAISLLQQAQLL